jgi:hypothetical protein
MRKILSWSGLLLLPGICFLSSCASYNVPLNAGSDRHVFLYVQSLPESEIYGVPPLPNATHGYSVSADGRLTPLSGYPQPGSFGGVISGKYLFTGDPDRLHLNTYILGADGSFTKIHSVLDQASVQCGSACWVFPDLTDRTGSSLYVEVYQFSGGDIFSSGETYSIDKNTGELAYAGQRGADWVGLDAECSIEFFSPDDLYGYGFCDYVDAPADIQIMGRKFDGSLDAVPNPKVTGPAAPPGFYGAKAAGGDAENHLAAVLYPFVDQNDNFSDLLVSYTINADGSLTTTNSIADMPAIPSLTAASMSPSGKLFAVGYKKGIQIFNFNGAAPMTPNSASIPSDTPATMQWDNDNHLFVLSYSHKLYVFTATGSSIVQAPGSPQSIANAQSLYIASN